jgi:hypothetical protein
VIAKPTCCDNRQRRIAEAKEPAYGGPPARLPGGPGPPAVAHPFPKGAVRQPGGRSKKQLHPLHALLADALNEPPSSRSTENGASKCEEVVAQLIDRLRDQVLSEMTRQIPG